MWYHVETMEATPTSDDKISEIVSSISLYFMTPVCSLYILYILLYILT